MDYICTNPTGPIEKFTAEHRLYEQINDSLNTTGSETLSVSSNPVIATTTCQTVGHSVARNVTTESVHNIYINKKSEMVRSTEVQVTDAAVQLLKESTSSFGTI